MTNSSSRSWTITSYANRTSPVNRGKYVLTNILGTPPPPPPEDVPPLDEKPGKAQSMRDRMEQHRANPACSGCHKLMDPIGLALENFDGIGRWRMADNGTQDQSGRGAFGRTARGWSVGSASGSGGSFRTVRRHDDRRAVDVRARSGHGHEDMPVVRSILKESARHEYRFSSLVLGIVKSVPFQMRRSES